MGETDLIQLLKTVSKRKYETQTEECKAARKGCPEHLYDTLSSFSNQSKGGVILFGVDEKNDFELCGVYDAQDLQKKVKNQCEDLFPAVRAFFTTATFDGKTFLSAEIPGINPLERPCYYKPKGKYGGSYIRVGDADNQMTEFEIYQYESYKKRTKDDIRTIDDDTIKLFYEEKHNRYLQTVKEKRVNLSQNVPDDEIDILMGLKNEGKPTLTAAMVFSKYPQTYFPQYSIVAVKIGGKSIADLGLDGERFIANEKITGPIDDMANALLRFAKANISQKTIINDEGRREDRYEYPLVAIREVILNALLHRDYSPLSEGMPIRFEIYSDRIEVTNPGQIFGTGEMEELGRRRLETRNPILADVLELLNVTRNRYSGIPTIRKEMKNYNLPQPVFISQGGEFKVILRNSFSGNEGDVLESVVDYCSTPRSREEIVRFVGKSRNYVVKTYIAPLVLSGQLKLTIPEKPQSPFQKYYS